jgi:hypothetical protein
MVVVAQLGDDDFVVRETAQAQLVAVGTPALLPLRVVAVCSTDLEVRKRANAAAQTIVINNRRRTNVHAEAWQYLGRPPMLDALWYSYGQHNFYPPESAFKAWLYGIYFPVITSTPDVDGKTYGRYYRATVIATNELLDLGVPAVLLKPIFTEMHKRDADFYKTAKVHNPYDPG